ncbi:MAG: insulinase family protein [Magnetococcales bacterium]|nr:insulinase family protein [Magnetococcales bacterium]
MMRWIGFCVGLTLLLGTTSTALALESREFRLDNGLKGVVVRESKAPVVIVQTWYRVGSADEKPGKGGLSHMLEHMMFQGTENLEPEEFSRLVAQEGGEDNASTTNDYTMYYIKLSADRAELALKLEAERMGSLLLAQEEFDAENLVVREERRVRIDADPNQRMLERYRTLAYGEHPYGRPVIGRMDEIAALTLDDLKAWYQSYYAPNNATIVVVGDVDPKQIEEWIRTHFDSLAAQPAPPRPRLPDPPRRTKPERLEVSDKLAKLPIWIAGYPVPGMAMPASIEDALALDVLAVILGHGSTSRLHQRLVRDLGVAVSTSASYSGFSASWELFSISAMPKPGADLRAIETVIFQEVERLTKEPVTARELEKARNGLIAEQVYSQDSIERIAWIIGRMTTNGLDWRLMLDDYPKRVRTVTSAAVQRVAARYLQSEGVTIGILKP